MKMYTKIILATIFVAFVSAQLAYTLQCYDCASPAECKSPKVSTCDAKAGNATVGRLGLYYSNVPNVTDTNFECLHLNGTENNVNTVEVRGCIFSKIDACTLTALPAHSSLARSNCTKCAGNLCNGKSPAGTFSSSFLTLMGSAVFLLFAKSLLL